MSYEYAKLAQGLGTKHKNIIAVEIMKYMGRSYEAYMSVPLEILRAVQAKIDLEAKKK